MSGRFVAGGWYHVCARGMERRSIFQDDQDRCRFLQLVGEVVEQFRLRAHAYVLMENHYHLLLQLGEANLARAIQSPNLREIVASSGGCSRLDGAIEVCFGDGNGQALVVTREGERRGGSRWVGPALSRD